MSITSLRVIEVRQWKAGEREINEFQFRATPRLVAPNGISPAANWKAQAFVSQIIY
jgi:hypothetical protein